MCYLYYRIGTWDSLGGKFPNRDQAEKFWNLVREKVRDEMGSDVQPVFVEIKQGRG